MDARITPFMKKPPSIPLGVMNPPDVVAVRLAFLIMVLLFTGTSLLILVGGLRHDFFNLAVGLVGQLLAVGLYDWLRREGRFAAVFTSLEELVRSAPAETEFTHLVNAWEDLHLKRGTAGFDVWELQRLRVEIEAKAKLDPSLADYWREHRP